MAKPPLVALLHELKEWYVIEPRSYPDFGTLHSQQGDKTVQYFGYKRGGALRIMTRDPAVMQDSRFSSALINLERDYTVYVESDASAFLEALICPKNYTNHSSIRFPLFSRRETANYK